MHPRPWPAIEGNRAREDSSRDSVGDELADPRLYRRCLSSGCTELGGAVWRSRSAEEPLWVLESVGN